MNAFRILILLIAAAFAALVVWAIGAASLSASFAAMAADPWGIVTLADLYLGFLAMAVVIAMTEERRAVAVVTVAAMALLGNLVTLAWLAWRLPRLAARLAQAR